MTAIGLRRDERHFYYWNGDAAVPGITTVQGVLDKPAIPNWAKKETAKAAVRNLATVTAMVNDDPVTDATLDQHPAVNYLKAMPGYQRDKAAEVGTLVHGIAESYALSETPDIPDHLAGFADAFIRDFVEQYKPTFHPLYVEAMVYHEGAEGVVRPYGGTMDAFVEIAGEIWLIDYKTSTNKKATAAQSGWPYKDTGLQLAAGRYASFIGREDDPKKYPIPKVQRCGVVAITPKEARLIEYEVTPVEFEAFAAARTAWDWVNQRSKDVKVKAA